MSKRSLEETTVGRVVNLTSNDVYRFDGAFKYAHYLWIGPLGTILIAYLLWLEIGWSALFGVSMVFINIPLQGTRPIKYNKTVRLDRRGTGEFTYILLMCFLICTFSVTDQISPSDPRQFQLFLCIGFTTICVFIYLITSVCCTTFLPEILLRFFEM